MILHCEILQHIQVKCVCWITLHYANYVYDNVYTVRYSFFFYLTFYLNNNVEL